MEDWSGLSSWMFTHVSVIIENASHRQGRKINHFIIFCTILGSSNFQRRLIQFLLSLFMLLHLSGGCSVECNDDNLSICTARCSVECNDDSSLNIYSNIYQLRPRTYCKELVNLLWDWIEMLADNIFKTLQETLFKLQGRLSSADSPQSPQLQNKIRRCRWNFNSIKNNTDLEYFQLTLSVK